MSKLLMVIGLFCVMSAHAANVTPYILINKEFRHLSQEESADKGSSTGITDVDGFETRLGVKSSIKSDDAPLISGKIELGINSARDNGLGERLRIRLAQIDLNGSFGKITIGKHWNPNSLRMLSLDPLTSTGGQLLGLESSDVEGALAGAFGLKARYFNNGITYASKKFAGIAFSVTFDQSADDLNIDSDGETKKWITSVITFDKTFGNYTFNSHISHATGDIEKDSTTPTPLNDESFNTIGMKFSCPIFGISLGYTLEDIAQDIVATEKVDIQREHQLAAIWYNLNKYTLAINYGKTTFDKKENIGSSTDNKGGSQTQIGAGVIYKLSLNLKTRIIYRNQKIETLGNGTIAGSSKENSASTYIVGLTLNF